MSFRRIDLLCIALAILLGLCPTLVQGSVVVEFRSVLPGSTFVNVTAQPYVSIDGSNNVTVANPNTGTWRIYSNNPGAESIGRISFTGSSGVAINLLIATPANSNFTFGTPFSADACVNWGGLLQGSTRTSVQSRCSGNVTGLVYAERIVRVDAGGSVLGNIEQVDAAQVSPLIYAVIATGGSIQGSIDAVRGDIQRVEASGTISGAITASAGSIGLVLTTSSAGNLLGSVRAPNGTISTINIAGNVGSPSQLITIQAKNGVGIITTTAAYANITTNFNNTDVTMGGLRRLRTSNGPFHGSLNARFLHGTDQDDGMFITGAIDANVTFSEDVRKPISATSLAMNKTIVLRHLTADGSMNFGTGPVNGTIVLSGNANGNIAGGALNGTVSMASAAANPSVPVTVTLSSIGGGGRLIFSDSLASTASVNVTGSLAGQIIINKGNLTPAGTWSGDVVVGTGGSAITLGPGQSQPNQAPYYDRVSSTIGGGAIGLAPFHIYNNDCAPVNYSYMTRQTFESAGAYVRYYGPVQLLQGGPPPTVEWQIRERTNNENVWVDVSSRFSVVVNPSGAASARSVRIQYTGSAGDLATGRYRMRVQPEGLVCTGVDGSPDVVGDYYFNIGLDCDGMNGVDAADFIPDAQWSWAIDCNGNNVLDTCELQHDASHVDKNGDGIIDECQMKGPCPCDFNGDSYLNSQDFFDYLNCFFGASCPPGRTADYNSDGFVNSQDFFDFLNCFFAGC